MDEDNKDNKEQPKIGPDDPTVEADEQDPTTPGPGDSDAGPPPSGEEPSDDDVIRPD